MRSEREIEELLCVVDDLAPSKYPALSYEAGVAAALRWAIGDDESPIEEVDNG